MTIAEKKEIVNNIIKLLIQLTVEDEHHEIVREVPVPAPVTVELPKPKNNVSMLTIKECTELIHGLTEHTVRMLVHQNKVSYFRAGAGERGKILVNKESLLSLFNQTEEV